MCQVSATTKLSTHTRQTHRHTRHTRKTDTQDRHTRHPHTQHTRQDKHTRQTHNTPTLTQDTHTHRHKTQTHTHKTETQDRDTRHTHTHAIRTHTADAHKHKHTHTVAHKLTHLRLHSRSLSEASFCQVFVNCSSSTFARMMDTLGNELIPVGFGPTQLALVELESTPLDHSGKVSTPPGPPEYGHHAFGDGVAMTVGTRLDVWSAATCHRLRFGQSN
jgi:hypothetical protein